MTKKVLIVDDNITNLYMLKSLLEGEGFAVSEAENGREALDRVHADPPDLIVSDILMPVMDGYTLCRQCKSDDQLKNIPFVFYTATYTEPKDEKFALSLGADRFILKPQEPENLIKVLQEFFDEKYTVKRPLPKPLGEEMEFFRGHNEILFKKLEKKMLDLEISNHELRILEEELRESEKKYRELYDFLPIPVYEMDLEANITSANRAIYETFGGTEEDLKKGFKAWRLLSPEDIVKSSKNIQRLLKGQQIGGTEYTLMRLDGSVFPALVISSVIYSNGKPVGLRGAILDITDRKRAEEALRSSEEEERRLAQENEVIAEIGRIISSSLDIDEVYGRFAEEVHKLIPIDRITINIINHKDNTVTNAYVSGTELPHRKKGNVYPLAFTITDEVRRTRAGLLINEENYRDYFDKFPGLALSLQAGFRSMMAIPLISKDEVIGALQFRSTELNTYSEKDMKLAERVASQIAGAIANAQLFLERKKVEKELEKTLDSLRKALGVTIQVMVSAIETRDPYTAGHQIRVADIARAIAAVMELPQEKIDFIGMVGSIHDIGKLSIPAEILSKPTKLSELEFSLIKEHAQKGYEILKSVESPLPLAQIVYQHHERMDGSGYPRHLKGDDILIEARILAVADVVESMSSHRPYRPAMDLDIALDEIIQNKSKLYDPDVSDACLKLFKEKGYKLPD